MHKQDNTPRVRSHAVGSTWWGQRWVEALEHGPRDVVARLGRGRAYARDGHVSELKIMAGSVVAMVRDDDLESYKVTLHLEVFQPKLWKRILNTMSEQALFVGQLLNGEMPREIAQVFHACGKSLFPSSFHDIDADCGCEDWSSPCKHVAATYYVLADALDHDPFILFKLRGRTREQVLSGLGQLRSGHASVNIGMPEAGVREASGIDLSQLAVNDYERAILDLSFARFNFDSLPESGALLRSIGRPASWTGDASPEELFHPIVLQAKQLALDIASGTHGGLEQGEVSPDKTDG